jgi:hypothetical protein
VFENGTHLCDCDSGKPLDKLGRGSAILEVLEKRGNRDARAAEYPGTADAFRIPFDFGTR